MGEKALTSSTLDENNDLFTEFETQAIDPSYRSLNVTLAIVFSLFFTLCIASLKFHPWFNVSDSFEPVALTVITLLLIFSVWFGFYHWFADPKIHYGVRKQDIVLHKGLFFLSITCQPIKRIQHVEIKQGPIERFYNLANLHIYSAGGAGHTFRVPGVTMDTAESLRVFILAHKDIHEDQ
jgi:membrane protein YdbS with pleckstrin-like domain